MKQNHISLALIVYLHPILATVPFQLLSDSLEIETFRKSGGIDRIGTWDLLGGKHTCLFLHKKNWIDSKLHICKVRTARDLIPPGLDVLYLIKISCLSTVLRLLEQEEELCEKFCFFLWVWCELCQQSLTLKCIFFSPFFIKQIYN